MNKIKNKTGQLQFVEIYSSVHPNEQIGKGYITIDSKGIIENNFIKMNGEELKEGWYSVKMLEGRMVVISSVKH